MHKQVRVGDLRNLGRAGWDVRYDGQTDTYDTLQEAVIRGLVKAKELHYELVLGVWSVARMDAGVIRSMAS